MTMKSENQRAGRGVPVLLGLLFVAVFGILIVRYSGETEEAETAMSATQITGTLTTEGVECPAMRGDDGQLYTLVGNLSGFKPGDRVRIEGELMLVSNCMQGQTIRLKTIKADTG